MRRVVVGKMHAEKIAPHHFEFPARHWWGIANSSEEHHRWGKYYSVPHFC